MDSTKRTGAPRTHILDRQIVASGKGGKPAEVRQGKSIMGNAYVCGGQHPPPAEPAGTVVVASAEVKTGIRFKSTHGGGGGVADEGMHPLVLSLCPRFDGFEFLRSF